MIKLLTSSITIGKIVNPLGNNNLTFWDFVLRMFNIVVPLAGIIFVVIFVYAGISYMLSTGEPQKVKSAQSMMTNAVIGFIIVAFAFVALRIVQNAILGIGN